MIKARRFDDLIDMQTVFNENSHDDDFGRPDRDGRIAVSEFLTLLNASRMKSWKPGDPIYRNGVRFLIGVATWSHQDMRLLDNIEKALLEHKYDNDRVDVFDFWSECHTQEELDRYIPGMDIGAIYHSPVVGRWENGILSVKSSGFGGRSVLLIYFGFCGE